MWIKLDISITSTFINLAHHTKRIVQVRSDSLLQHLDCPKKFTATS